MQFFYASNKELKGAFRDALVGVSGIDIQRFRPALARPAKARMARSLDQNVCERFDCLLKAVAFIRDGKQFAQKLQRNGFAAFQFADFLLSFVTSAKILGVLATSIVIPFEFGTKGHHKNRSLRDPGFHGFFVDCHPSARSHAS